MANGGQRPGKALAELAASFQGYAEGARAVLAAARKGDLRTGFRPILDALRVPPAWKRPSKPPSARRRRPCWLLPRGRPPGDRAAAETRHGKGNGCREPVGEEQADLECGLLPPPGRLFLEA